MKLSHQSNETLLATVDLLIKSERTCTAKLVAHLAEINRRCLHLKLGYASMFEYCTKHLLLDPGQVWLRLQVAKKCQQFPRLLEDLAAGELSLTVCGQLAAHLTPSNCERLLADCRDMTRREVDAYLVTLKPKPEKSPSIRAAAESQQPVASSSKAKGLAANLSNLLDNRRPAEGSEPAAANTSNTGPSHTPIHPKTRPATCEPATPQRYNISLSVDRSVKEKLERLAEVLGKSSLRGDMEEVLAFAVEVGLEKKDPIRKAAGAAKRKKRLQEVPQQKAQQESINKEAPRSQPIAGEAVKESLHSEPKTQEPMAVTKVSRTVPAMHRRQVMKRAGYQCEYIGITGRRCTAKVSLEIDHLRPYGMGGDHSPENLRLVCRVHNLAKAKSDYVEEFIATKISSAGGGATEAAQSFSL